MYLHSKKNQREVVRLLLLLRINDIIKDFLKQSYKKTRILPPRHLLLIYLKLTEFSLFVFYVKYSPE